MLRQPRRPTGLRSPVKCCFDIVFPKSHPMFILHSRRPAVPRAWDSLPTSSMSIQMTSFCPIRLLSIFEVYYVHVGESRILCMNVNCTVLSPFESSRTSSASMEFVIHRGCAVNGHAEIVLSKTNVMVFFTRCYQTCFNTSQYIVRRIDHPLYTVAVSTQGA